MNLPPFDPTEFAARVAARVPGYRRFLELHGVPVPVDVGAPFERLPLVTKQSYLLPNPIEDLCWDGTIGDCHLIGASSGFSKSGSVFWPKRPADERGYLESVEHMLVEHYAIDRHRTLVFCCMALGTWFGGMALTAALRILATQGRLPITVCTPGLNLAEAVEVYARFHGSFARSLWLTNPSSIGLVGALLRARGLAPPPASMSFAVVGEYFSETFRETIAARYGHDRDAPFVVWTGYGSADAGDLGVETAASIALRKWFHRHAAASARVFGGPDTPMLLAPAPGKHLEIVDGRIVVTADHLVPLVRYDTGDAGGFVGRGVLAGLPDLDPALVARLPERVLFVRGRAADNVIFYGTNLNVQEINDCFLGLPADHRYAGRFTVRPRQRGEVTFFDFTVFVEGAADPALAARYQAALIAFLTERSLEFQAKYQGLSQAIGEPLIQLRVAALQAADARVKHRFVETQEP